MAVQNITKKCKACEINFDKLKGKKPAVQTEFKYPTDIPISVEMKKNVEALRKSMK